MIWLKAQLSRLITRFSTEQKLISAGHMHVLTRLSFIPQILVGRDYCQYACLNLEHVPRAKRERALKNQIDLLSTWADVRYSVAWQNGYAQVWFWSAQEIEGLLNHNTEVSGSRAGLYKPTFLSEVLYWTKPGSMGLHLFKAYQGYDLQYWDNGLLRGSQWYAHVPSQQQLQRFSRSQGLSSSVDGVTVNQPVPSGVLWDGVISSAWGHFFERRSQIAIWLVALSLLIMSLQLTAVARWYWEEASLEKQTKELSLSANELINARNQARLARAETLELHQLLSMPNPLASQLAVFKYLPADLKLSLQTWERNINQVDMTVSGDIPDTLSLVRAFEQNGMKGVRVEPLSEPSKYRVRLMLSETLQQGGDQ
jgi:hypothetical protein